MRPPCCNTVATLNETVFAHPILWSFTTEAALLSFPIRLRHLDLHSLVRFCFSLCSHLFHSVLHFKRGAPKE
jgi:hypothetical protein